MLIGTHCFFSSVFLGLHCSPNGSSFAHQLTLSAHQIGLVPNSNCGRATSSILREEYNNSVSILLRAHCLPRERTKEEEEKEEKRRGGGGGGKRMVNRDKGGEQARNCCLEWCKRASRVANASRRTLASYEILWVWVRFLSLVVWSSQRSTSRVKQTEVPFSFSPKREICCQTFPTTNYREKFCPQSKYLKSSLSWKLHIVSKNTIHLNSDYRE